MNYIGKYRMEYRNMKMWNNRILKNYIAKQKI